MASAIIFAAIVPSLGAIEYDTGRGENAQRQNPPARPGKKADQIVAHFLALRGDAKARAKQRAELFKDATGIKERNNYAVALLHLGKTTQAIGILNQLELEQPGEYPIAVNLATAYEQDGDLTSALKWIREAAKRNPAGREGTEWLFALLLERRINGNTTVFDTEIQADYDDMPALTATYDGGTYVGMELLLAIALLCEERAAFVGPKDALMADLFAHAGYLAWESNPHSAVAYWKLAVKYGHPRSNVVEASIEDLEKEIKAAKDTDFWFQVLNWGIGASLLVAVLMHLSTLRKRQW